MFICFFCGGGGGGGAATDLAEILQRTKVLRDQYLLDQGACQETRGCHRVQLIMMHLLAAAQIRMTILVKPSLTKKDPAIGSVFWAMGLIVWRCGECVRDLGGFIWFRASSPKP